MDDDNAHPNIDQLRELAFASLPRKSLCWIRKDDKEEGELSSNDEAELSEFAMACPGIAQKNGRKRRNARKTTAARKRKQAIANYAQLRIDLGNSMLNSQDKAAADVVVSPPPTTTSTTPRNHLTTSTKCNGGNTTTPTARPASHIWSPAENPFLIRFFDEDTESEEERPSGNPANLSLEITRIRKQIAAMERRGNRTTTVPSRVTKARGTGSGPDLETLRKQIASKESELQRQRMRVAAQVPSVPKEVPQVRAVPVEVTVEEPRPVSGVKHPRDDVETTDASKKAKLVHHAAEPQPEPVRPVVTEPVVEARALESAPSRALDSANGASTRANGTSTRALDSANGASTRALDSANGASTRALDSTNGAALDSVTGAPTGLDIVDPLEKQEEALDNELETAQQLRHRCEVRERLARRAYREAQEALRVSNLECEKLLQKREFLSLRVRAAELSRYSSRSGLDSELALFDQALGLMNKPAPAAESAGNEGPRRALVAAPENDALRPTVVPTPIVQPEMTFKDKPRQEQQQPEKGHNSTEKQLSSTEKQQQNSTERQQNSTEKQQNSTEKSTEKQQNSTEKQQNCTEKQQNCTEKQQNSMEKQKNSTEKQQNSSERRQNHTEKRQNSTEKQQNSTHKQRDSTPRKQQRDRAPRDSSPTQIDPPRAPETPSTKPAGADGTKDMEVVTFVENSDGVMVLEDLRTSEDNADDDALRKSQAEPMDVETKVSEDQEDIRSSSSGYTSDRKGDDAYIAFGSDVATSPPNRPQGNSPASSLEQENGSPADLVRGEEPSTGPRSENRTEEDGLLVVFRQVPPLKGLLSEPKTDGRLPAVPDAAAVSGRYESPLGNFRSFRASPRFTSAFGLSSESKTWSHSIDPFKPLCKYEHRGKCNNEVCTMQHAHDYEIDSMQLGKDLQCYHGEGDGSKMVPSDWKWSNPAAATDTPVYRIGKYLMRGWHFQKDGNSDLYDFMLSISAPRPLPRDMACLLDDSNGSAIADYVESDVNSNVERQTLTEYADVELCLDISLRILQYDVNNVKKSNSNCLKNALRVLSRSLETNRQSVVLWVVYLTLFHKQGSPVKHDMFEDAVQCCKGSYVLWSMFINTRTSLKSQLDAFEDAISALCDANDPARGMSGCILDLTLRMLYTMAVSESTQQIDSWTDDLTADVQRRKSTSKLLRNLRPSDACVLRVSCGHLAAYGTLPTVVVDRLGCKQGLPFGLEWQPSSSAAGDDVRRRVTKLLDVGGFFVTMVEGQALAVNYVKFLAAFEGMPQAAEECQRLLLLQPRCVELIGLLATIEKQRHGTKAGLAVFEKGISGLPCEGPGIQMLWNQYAGYTLEWLGSSRALAVLDKCASCARESCHLPCNSKSRFKQQPPQLGPVDSLKSLSSASRDLKDGYSRRDSVFSSLNIALYEALRGHSEEAQVFLEKALAVDEGFGHTWEEYAAFRLTGGSRDFAGFMNVVDRCYRVVASKLRPLGREFLDGVKKYRNRCFVDNLLGSAPVNYTFVNSLLRTAFGVGLLPTNTSDLKSLEDFAGGLLEICPGNVDLALALCRAIKANSATMSRPSSVATSVWAGSLLLSSLQGSGASEARWLEAIDVMQQLGLEDALAGVYNQAEAAYPYSVKLRRHRMEFFQKK